MTTVQGFTLSLFVDYFLIFRKSAKRDLFLEKLWTGFMKAPFCG